MYSKLLKRQDYKVLLDMKSIQQVTAYLKKKPAYDSVLAEIDENDVHRRAIEQTLKKSLFDDYGKLLWFCTDDYRAGLRQMLLSYEVEDMKLLISSVCTGHRYQLRNEELIFIRNLSKMDLKSLLSSETLSDLVENLKDTRYYKPLLSYVNSGASTNTGTNNAGAYFFAIDNMIDIFN